MEILARLIFGKLQCRSFPVLKLDTTCKKTVIHCVVYSENDAKFCEPDALSPVIDMFETKWNLQVLQDLPRLDNRRDNVLANNALPMYEYTDIPRDQIEIFKSDWAFKVFHTILRLTNGKVLSQYSPSMEIVMLEAAADDKSSPGYGVLVDTNLDSAEQNLKSKIFPLGSGIPAYSNLVTSKKCSKNEKRMSQLEDYCNDLERKVKELETERDREMCLRRESESSLEMIKQEYTGVINALKEKCAHGTRARDMLKQNIEALSRQNRSILSQLQDSSTEREAILLKLSELSPGVQKCDGTDLSPLADKTALRDIFDVFLNKMKTENHALEDEASNLRLKVDHLSLFKNHYYEELKTKENHLKEQHELIASQKRTMEALRKKNKVMKDQLENAFKRLDNILSVKTELEFLKINNQENDIKLQRELSELKSIIESSTVQIYGQRTERCGNCTLLNEMTAENNALKIKESDLKNEVKVLSSDRNTLREELQARDSQMEYLNSDVLALIHDLEIALQIVKEVTD